uniref:3FTx-Cac-16 n=1 Tax=Cacophis squamulosus TaxID=505434 RepID=R4G2F2_9SAUR
MKTLLLTLVVVTIVCLDLGDSLICYVGYNAPRTCPNGQKLCYKITSCVGVCPKRDQPIEMGCAATCPIRNRGVKVICCSTDRCNKLSNWERP